MILVSMLLVIVGAVTLVIGVFFGDDSNLTWVYVSIASCLLAGLFLVAGILRNRPSRKPVLGSDGGDATWSGATAWPGTPSGPQGTAPGAATGVLEREPSAEESEIQIVTAPAEAPVRADEPVVTREPAAEDFAPAREPEPAAEDSGEDEDVVVVRKRGAEPLAGRTGAAKKTAAKKTAAKKASAKKTAAKKSTAKKSTAKKTTAKKTAAKKAPAKKTAAKKSTAKKTTAKKTAAKKAPAKKTAAKKTTPRKRT